MTAPIGSANASLIFRWRNFTLAPLLRLGSISAGRAAIKRNLLLLVGRKDRAIMQSISLSVPKILFSVLS
ncbi:MAG: hypothetical protein ACM3JD_05640, partial [Rudaea sp.]